MGLVGALTTISIGTQLFGAAKKAKAEKNAAKAEGARLRLNAEIAEQEAKALRRSQLEEQHIRKEHARREVSSARAKIAKSGFAAGKSSLLVLTQLTEDMAKDIETVSRERDVSVRRKQDEARIGRISAKDVESAGKITSQTTLLAGAGGAASTGAQFLLDR